MTNNYIKVHSPHTNKIVELVFFDDSAPSSLPAAEAHRFRREKGSAAFNEAARVKAEHDATLTAEESFRGRATLSVWRKGCPGVPTALLEVGQPPAHLREAEEDPPFLSTPRPMHPAVRRVVAPLGGVS